jgi:AcrR family transcriptional regulator
MSVEQSRGAPGDAKPGVRRMPGETQAKAKALDRAGRERALIAAASKLFASRGYEATTTREIAKVAGCAEGLISRYFHGKAGLLLALFQLHITEQAVELNDTLPPADTLEEEIVQLTEWVVEHMWSEREFLKVVVPQVLLDPALGEDVIRTGPVRRGLLIAERLKKYDKGRALPAEEVRALAEAISCLGLVFGFMHPTGRVVSRENGKAIALTIGKMLSRSV